MSLHVSRETEDRLEAFRTTLTAWNAHINLVSRTAMEDLWTRHILDSLQLLSLSPLHARRWLDLGTGGGFPGLIIAIAAVEHRPELEVTLVESDRRKAAFLVTAARAAGVNPVVHAMRAEELAPHQADVVSARALAPLPRLLPLAYRHLAASGVALFPKGRQCDSELHAALESWRFRVQKVPSQTDPTGVILVIEDIARA